MENRGLLFIPDISGFTRFVTETEISHSQMIIKELLEILINANELGLEVSEIEGDAILFYKFGDPPELESIYRQVEKMFRSFHQSLIAYDTRKYCQCKACLSAIDLSLKVITHYGEFTGYNVKQFSKLIGKDVIVAHQLLKNDIDDHEYWLVTKNLLQEHVLTGFADWMKWNTSVKQTESGEIPFHYTQLSQLKKELSPEPTPRFEIADKFKAISWSKEYDKDIITLFHATGNFNYRPQWREGVIKVEEVNHFLPRVGMRSRFVMKDGAEVIYSSSYFYQPDRIEFSETDEQKRNSTYYTLEKVGGKTRLTLDYYIRKSMGYRILFSLTKRRKMEVSFKKSLDNLVGLVRELRIPSAIQSSSAS
ncbi:MAG TPA: DUF2652 domain-containing protein [Cyclobacteriaceae bacterium]|nr:DUF2652 domain-containing protein [Cyclobacteriaceae bacterium]